MGSAFLIKESHSIHLINGSILLANISLVTLFIPMRDPSNSRASTLTSLPPSARSFLYPPSRSELHPDTIRQQLRSDEAVAMLVPKPKAAHKALRLKAVKQKQLDSRNLTTAGASSIALRVGITSLDSKPKVATTSSRPASRAAKRPAILCETSRNITPIAQNQMATGPKIGPENWTTITAAKVITQKPPPKLKLHKFKRATILPKIATESLFSPPQNLPERPSDDVFYDGKCNSYAPSAALSPDTPAAKLTNKARSATLPLELQRTRPALILPSRHLEIHDRTASKSVRWDPSILVDWREPSQGSEGSSETEENIVAITNQDANPKLDVQDCVETIKEWRRTDSLKLEKLLEALKQLELDSEERKNRGGLAKPNVEAREGVVITTSRSLNPRVPDFLSSKVSHALEKPENQPLQPRSAKTEVKTVSREENITHQEPNNIHPGCKKRAICDDYNAHGRQVDAFEQWYAEMQLREFVKRYPLTGKRVSAVVGEKASHTAMSVPRSRKGDVYAMRNDGHWVKNNGFAERKYICPRREEIVATSGLSAGRHAAAIQQRLEFLLLKRRERMALEALALMETETEDKILKDWL